MAATSLEPVQNPFTIITDDREKLPYGFANITADANQQYRPLIVPCAIRRLSAGDYTIDGFESAIAVERKSLQDIYGTIGQNRDRFERELARLKEFEFASVVVEATVDEIIRNPPTRSELAPKTIIRSVLAWEQRYRVHFHFLPGRQVAEAWTFQTLRRFWVDKQPRKESGK